MSIPTLPGTSRRPRKRHPGAENIEKDMEDDPDETPPKPNITLPKSRAPKSPIPKINQRKPQPKTIKR
jgi:hypothetical protein